MGSKLRQPNNDGWSKIVIRKPTPLVEILTDAIGLSPGAAKRSIAEGMVAKMLSPADQITISDVNAAVTFKDASDIDQYFRIQSHPEVIGRNIRVVPSWFYENEE